MKTRKYNEVYGYLPDEFINQLPSTVRDRMFLEWIMREPTPTGWYIVKSVVASLGEEFIKYLFDGVVESLKMDEEEVTRDVVVERVESLLETCATDINILYDLVDTYLTEVKSPEKEEKQPRDSKGRFLKKN